MTNAYRSPYWDSSVWIALVAGEVVGGVNRAEIAQHILEDAEQGKVTILTSAFTLAEVLKKKGRPVLAVAAEETIRSYFEHSFIRIVVLDRVIGELAASVARQHNLSPPDAIHVASALTWKADVLHTWDDGLVKKSGQIGNPPLRIEHPGWTGQQPLPLPT